MHFGSSNFAGVIGQAAFFAALLIALSGCSTIRSALTPPPPRTAVAAVPPPTDPHPKAKAEAVAPAAPATPPAPERKIATVDPDRLLGLNPDAVGGVLGRPDKRNKDDMALAWTYTGNRCALQLYFYPDVKTGSMRVLKYKFRHRARGNASNDKQCLSTIMATRK